MASIFFISFLLIGLFLLMNLLLALLYNNYKMRQQKNVDNFEGIRQDYFLKIFEELDIEQNGYITTEQFKEKIGGRFISNNPQIIKFLAVVEKESDGKIYRARTVKNAKTPFIFVIPLPSYYYSFCRISNLCIMTGSD